MAETAQERGGRGEGEDFLTAALYVGAVQERLYLYHPPQAALYVGAVQEWLYLYHPPQLFEKRRDQGGHLLRSHPSSEVVRARIDRQKVKRGGVTEVGGWGVVEGGRGRLALLTRLAQRDVKSFCCLFWILFSDPDPQSGGRGR